MPKRNAGNLLGQLADTLSGRIEVGAIWKGEIVDGDLVAEVVVTVRQRVDPQRAAEYRAAAVEVLRAESYRVRRCECSTKPSRALLGRQRGSCRGRVVAVVVSKAWLDRSQLSFRFICGLHRNSHGVDPASVLAVLDLPDALLKPIHAIQDEKDREWEARRRVEEAAEEEERRRRRAGRDAQETR